MNDHPGNPSTTTSRGVNRRRFIQAGAAGAVGLAAAQAQARAARGAASGRHRAKSVILIFNCGGPSHTDLWDMKPGAPDEFRGTYKPIPTNVSGIEISELLPRLASGDVGGLDASTAALLQRLRP